MTTPLQNSAIPTPISATSSARPPVVATPVKVPLKLQDQSLVEISESEVILPDVMRTPTMINPNPKILLLEPINRQFVMSI